MLKKLHSLDKKLYFCFYLMCKHSKTPCKKGKQQISKEWTKQLTQMPLKKNKTSSILNELLHVPNTGLWIDLKFIIVCDTHFHHISNVQALYRTVTILIFRWSSSI